MTKKIRCSLGTAVMGLALGLPGMVRADDAKAPSTPAHPASAPARTQDEVMKDINAAGRQLQEVIGSKGEAAFTDAKTRKEIAAKAIPAMKAYLKAFDELAGTEPAARSQSSSVHGQFLSMMTVLGDADAE